MHKRHIQHVPVAGRTQSIANFAFTCQNFALYYEILLLQHQKAKGKGERGGGSVMLSVAGKRASCAGFI